MKNLILSAAVLIALTFNASAAPVEPDNKKVQETFDAIFKDAIDVSWTNDNKNYEAFFIADNIKTRATIDAKGNLLQTIRYYQAEDLPANVLYHVTKEFKGQDVFGVTEVSNRSGVHYRIVLRDDSHYTHIYANNAGDTEVVATYKRGDK